MKRNRLRLAALLLAAVLLFAATPGSYGWFGSAVREAFASHRRIKTPPIILVNNGEGDVYRVIDLENVQLLSDIWLVFCTMPQDGTTAIPFGLELAYTRNMGEEIDVYPLTYYGTTQPQGALYTDYVTWADDDSATHYYNFAKKENGEPQPLVRTDLTNTKSAYQAGDHVQQDNAPTYLFYDNGTVGNEDYLGFRNGGSGLGDTSQYRFFALKIHWPSVVGFIDEKETDLVYVTAKGDVTDFGA